MGDLIRFVSSHRVGHTFRFAHNLVQLNVPVEKVPRLKVVEANGHKPSDMDYAPINYVGRKP